MFLALINREDYNQTKPCWLVAGGERCERNIDKDGPRQKEERFGPDLSWHKDMTDSLTDIDLAIGVASTGFFRCCNLNSALLWLRVC